MTPLLTRIDQQLERSSDPDERAELLAERACYLARVGDFDGANGIIASLRRIYGDGRNARVSVWLMLAEGLVLYFESLDIRSRDRIYRASALAQSFHLSDLDLLSTSWLAHIEFNQSNFPRMIDALKRCTVVPSEAPSAWAVRMCIVLADAYAFSRQPVLSRYWYDKARQGATALGDEAAIGALIYNRAAIVLTNLRLDAADGNVGSDEVKFSRLELESSRNFQIHTRNLALNQLIDSCLARSMLLEGKYADSAVIFESLIRRHDGVTNFDSSELQLKIEFIECLIRMGNIERATLLMEDIDPSSALKFTPDDLYIFMNLYVKIVAELNLPLDTSRYRLQVGLARESYSSSVHHLKLQLESLGRPVLMW